MAHTQIVLERERGREKYDGIYGNGNGKTERYMSYGDATEFCRNWNKINYIECVYINCIHTHAYVYYTQMHTPIRECFSDFLGMYCSLNSRRHKGLYFCFSQTYSPQHTNWILWVCMPFHMHVCARAHVYTLMRMCMCLCQCVCSRASHSLTTYLMYTSIEVHVCI